MQLGFYGILQITNHIEDLVSNDKREEVMPYIRGLGLNPLQSMYIGLAIGEKETRSALLRCIKEEMND